MNTTRFFAVLFGIFATGLLQAADSPKTSDRVQVMFDHPEKFTDVKDGELPTDKGRDYILSQIHDYLVSHGTRDLPAGDTLAITFTDIDLAGDFEPWHGPNWDNVRILKDVYPPHLVFSYILSDSAGKVLAQGKENLLDMNYQMRLILDTSDSLRYEKDMLNEWLTKKIRYYGKS